MARKSDETPVEPLESKSNAPIADEGAEARIKEAEDRAIKAEADATAAKQELADAKVAATVMEPDRHQNETCWNCKAQDRKTKNRLNDEGVCDTCGFNKNTLYNSTLEAEKAGQRG